MKIKAYPRHEIKFNFLQILSFFIRRKKSLSYANLFKDSFLSLTNAKYAVLIPSCRTGVFHTLDFLKEQTTGYAISGTTFSAMKVCIDHFIDKSKDVELIDNESEIDLSTQNQVVLLTHLFGSQNFKLSTSSNSFVIEDCAHCFIPAFLDKKYELRGDAAIFSFGVGKSLNTLGGGILITNNYDLLLYIQDKMLNLKCSNSKILKAALKTWVMSLATRGMWFSLITFPIIKFISFFNANFLDHALNEHVSTTELLQQVSSPNCFHNLQAFLGTKQIENFEELNKKRANIISLLINNTNCIYHPFLSTNFTYLMIPFKECDTVRKKLMSMRIDTKLSDMDCYYDDSHPLNIKNKSYLEIPFSEEWDLNDVLFISNALNQVANNVIID